MAPPLRRSRPLSLALGLGCLVLGAVLITRPFTSLSVLTVLVAVSLVVTGASELHDADLSTSPWFRRVVGAGCVVGGVVAIAWPDITVRGLALLVGVSMIVGGVANMIAGIGGSVDERLSAIIGGLASLLFGLLALAWPDVTLLVVAVVFGARTLLFGFAQIAVAVQSDERSGATSRPRGRLRRRMRVVGTIAALLLALVCASISAKLREAEPHLDAFYRAPTGWSDAEPGALLRSEPFDRRVPDGAEAFRILYRTTRADGEPAIASGLVVVPRDRAAGALPVIAWAHGTTGVARKCAPSALSEPFESGAMFILDLVVDEGWALVATDYVGLGAEGAGHPYLVGEPAGRSVLDAVRASKQLPDVALADEAVVWGHSQGGGAALWTGGIAPKYAPDVDVVGVAAMAPASDLVGLVDALFEIRGGSIFASYVVRGFAHAYDDVRVGDAVRPSARVTFDGLADRCLGEPAVLISVLASITTDMSIFSPDFVDGPMLERLEANVPPSRIDAPLLLAQGGADRLVLPEVQAEYVATLCRAGQAVDFHTYPGRDHVSLVQADSPAVGELIDWTNARLAGEPPVDTCE